MKSILFGFSLVFRVCPRVIRAKFLIFLSRFLFYCLPFRRYRIVSNLKFAFSISKEKAWEMSKRNYEHYALMIGEWLETISWSKTDYLNNVEIVGLENVSKYYEKGVGGFFLTCHLGNWEVLVSSGAAAGIPVDIIVKKAKYRFLEKIIVGYREKLGAGIIYETRTTRDILKKISQGRFVGFMLDQFMGPPLGIPARFFGKIAGTTVSLALLSDRRNTPVVPAFSFRRNGKLYTVIEPAFNWSLFDVPTDSMERLAFKTQVFNDWVEQKVREHPDQWLWLHHRWKPFVGETKWQN